MITSREAIALILLVFLLVLYGNIEAKERDYFWIYGEYKYMPERYNDPYLILQGQEQVLFNGGYAKCVKVDESTFSCIKTYYQHQSFPDTSKDIGENSLNIGGEIRWY